jgi:hypothetical protein
MDVQFTSLEAASGSVQSKTVSAKKEKSTQVNVRIDVQVDIYEHTRQEKKVTYDKPGVKPDMKTIQQLKEESDIAYAHLKQIVSEMLKRQGLKFQDIDPIKSDDIKIEDLKDIAVDETARKEAQAMIAEGGEYSAEKVSDRIVNFAKAISGGDKSKLDLLKAAIDRGFEAAEADFGDELPDISKETHRLIMAKLDDWAKEDEAPTSQPEDESSCKSTGTP